MLIQKCTAGENDCGGEGGAGGCGDGEQAWQIGLAGDM